MWAFLNRLRMLPVAIHGLAISLITQASFYGLSGWPYLAQSCLLAAIILIGLKISKYLLHPDMLFAELDNYLLGAYLPLFSMFLATLAHNLYPHRQILAEIIWYCGFTLHFCLLAYLYYSHGRQHNFAKILPSWFIPPIGYIAVGLNALDYYGHILSQIIFAFAAIVIIPLSLAIFQRQLKHPLNNQEFPTMGIYAAPISLLLLAYLAVFPQNSYPVVLTTLISVNLIYNLLSCYGLYRSLGFAFNPGLASFTFPFAVASLAFYKCQSYAPFMTSVAWLCSAAASLMTVYVLIRLLLSQLNNTLLPPSKA